MWIFQKSRIYVSLDPSRTDFSLYLNLTQPLLQDIFTCILLTFVPIFEDIVIKVKLQTTSDKAY